MSTTASRLATLLLLGILTLPSIVPAQPVSGRAITEVGAPQSMPLPRAVLHDAEVHPLEPRGKDGVPTSDEIARKYGKAAQANWEQWLRNHEARERDKERKRAGQATPGHSPSTSPNH